MERTESRPAVIPPVPAVLAAVVSVQGGAAIAKGLFPVLGATGTAGMRIALSALMLLAAFRPALTKLSAAQWRLVVPYGACLGLMNAVFYASLARIPLGLAVTIEFVGPLAVAVFGSRRALDLVWVVMAGAGIALIAPWHRGAGPTSASVDPLGVLFALLAGGCWAAYIVLGARLSRRLAGGTAVSAGMLVATLTVLPFALAAGGLAHLTPRLALAAAAVALLSSALPYALEMIALRALPTRTFSILMSLEPAVAALCGLAFLGERLAAAQWLAIALVIAASLGATMTARQSVASPIEV
jgi:inner membrane transporter RhtA